MAAIFLDLDGTLVDPYEGIHRSFAHALAELGLPSPAPGSLRWVIGPALIDSLSRAGAPDPEAALALYRARYSKVGLYEAAPYPGIAEALAALKADGHNLYLATAKPHVYARRVTAHFGLDGFLDRQYGPELDGTRGDKGVLLAHALAELGLDGPGCVMVGDRRHDIDAARAVGMAALAVSWGFGAASEWAQADAVCTAPADLPTVLRTLAGNVN